ncbi:MAG: BTAD domain-containing putative transcriptional regulator [Nocardioidaceae bacterium]
MRVRLLGPLELEPEGRGLSPRDRIVLAALVVRSGVSCSADELADALWGDHPPASWSKVVQGCVMRLRRALGPDSIRTTGTGYILSTSAIDLDVQAFARAIEQAREHCAAGMPERAVPMLERALGLWRGRPFDELEDWLPGRLEAERLTELRRAAQEDLLEARLQTGEHREVAADGMVLVGEEPWRERRWALLALAQYRGGRQAEALASIRRARRALDHQLGLDLGAELVTLERAILSQDPGLAAEHDDRGASPICPYKGLSSYDADDSEAFFGRAVETVACLERLKASPLLVLAGPSGCGKSSLMRAGVVPDMRRAGRRVAVLTPGSDPAASLAIALARERGSPVLLVDQFEEAFGPSADPVSVRRWLGSLAEYAVDRAPVVVTIRADHLSELTTDDGFAQLAERGLHLVSPLSGTALREAIEGPARMAGLRMEHGLVDLLVRDAEDQPGALPLLSHALAETWQRREGRVLTVDGYRATGGIRGAVGRSADQLYESLTPAERPSLRWLLLRLVSLGDDGEPIRSRLSRSSLVGEPERLRLIDMLVRARLVTAETESYEIAHEALARAWPRLRSWLDEDTAGQRIVRHLSTAAEGWDSLGLPDTELYQGSRLEAALEWRAGSTVALTKLEQHFLETSEDRAVSARRALEVQSRHQRRLNRRLRGLLAVVASLLVVALIAGLAAIKSGKTAGQQRDAAQAAELRARHDALVSQSLSLRTTNRSAAALLAVVAYRQDPDALSSSALLGTFSAAPGFLGYHYVDAAGQLNGVLLPATDTAVVTDSTGQLQLLDLETGRLHGSFAPPPPHALEYTVLRTSADGRYVAALAFAPKAGQPCGYYDSLLENNGRGCSALSVYDVRTGKVVFGPVVPPFSGGDVAVNADGSMVAVAGGLDGDLAIYGVDAGPTPVGRLAGLSRPPDVFLWRDTAAVAFGRGDELYVGSMAGQVRQVDLSTMRVERRFSTPLLASHDNLVVTSDDRLIAVGDQAIVAVDLASGRRLWAADLRDRLFPEPCPFFALAEKVGRMYCGNYFGQLDERDLDTGERTGIRLDPQLGSVGDLVAAHNGRELIAFGAGGSPVYSRWRLDGAGLVSSVVAEGRLSVAGYDPTGTSLLVASQLGVGTDAPGLQMVDAVTGDVKADIAAGQPTWVGPDSVLTIGGRRNGVYDVASDELDRWPGVSPRSYLVVRELDSRHAWVVSTRNDGSSLLRRLDVVTGQPTGEQVTVNGFVQSLVTSPDGGSVYVNHAGDDNWVTSVFDTASGKLLREGLDGQARLAMSAKGILIGADPTGDVTQFDPDTLEPVANLPGARGGPHSLQFSADGSTLLVTTGDQSVQVYDVATRTRLGEAITSAAVNGEMEGWLRPDGMAVAVNGRLGVSVWSLNPPDLAAAACELAGRNLTRTEWETYLGSDVAYRPTCPQFTTPVGG